MSDWDDDYDSIDDDESYSRLIILFVSFIVLVAIYVVSILALTHERQQQDQIRATYLAAREKDPTCKPGQYMAWVNVNEQKIKMCSDGAVEELHGTTGAWTWGNQK